MPELRDLYPIPTRHEEADSIVSIVFAEKRPDGSYRLHRDLTSGEKAILRKRLTAIVSNLDRAARRQTVAEIETMIATFDRRAKKLTPEDYADLLDGGPLWAIARTCLRFSRREVAPAELEGAEPSMPGHAPLPEHVRIVATAMISPFLQEATRLRRTLDGKVIVEATPDERRASEDRVRELNRAFRIDMDARAAVEQEQAAARREQARRRAEKGNERDVASSYLTRGIPPVYAGPAAPGLMLSVPLLLSLGYTIEDGPLGPRLIRPPARPTEPPEGDGRGQQT